MMKKTSPTMRMLARRYLAHRRKLGYSLRIEGRQIEDFARYADRVAAHKPMTAALALQWATLPQTPNHRLYHAKRLESLRGFARYCSIFEPATEVPSTRMIGPAHRRRAPHIYSPNQIRLLLHRAATLPVVFLSDPLRPLTYVTLIGLIACTAIRLGEALRLTIGDFDEAAGTLRVPRSKFSPERLLPLHSSTVRALHKYRLARMRHPSFTDLLFVGRNGGPLNQRTVHSVFRAISGDLVVNGDRVRPRIHDLRHTFATRLIAKWSQQRSPLAHHLLLLCRYLGHQAFEQTFWYVSSDAKAFNRTSQQFNSYCHSAHDRDPVPVPNPTVFRSSPNQPAQRQPPNGHRLPRYLPALASLSWRPPTPSD